MLQNWTPGICNGIREKKGLSVGKLKLTYIYICINECKIQLILILYTHFKHLLTLTAPEDGKHSL